MITFTSREVRFTPFPADASRIEEGMDALVDRYWTGWRNRVFATPSIGGRCGTEAEIHFGIARWWVPAWFALRQVTDVMAHLDIGGAAVYVRERVSLDW